MEPCILLQIDSTVQSSGCYLNADDLTYVFTSHSIMMCKKDGVSKENLNLIEANGGVNFQLIF